MGFIRDERPHGPESGSLLGHCQQSLGRENGSFVAYTKSYGKLTLLMYQLCGRSASRCLPTDLRAVPYVMTLASSPTSEIWLADAENMMSKYIKGLTVLWRCSYIVQHHFFGLSSTFFEEFVIAASTATSVVGRPRTSVLSHTFF